MFIQPEDVQTSARTPDLDVSVVRAVPLIERFENVDLMTAEMKPFGHGQPAIAGMLFCLNS
jgi:hypothetical protein